MNLQQKLLISISVFKKKKIDCMIQIPFYNVDIEDLERSIQEQLFDEILDRDVQNGLYIFFKTVKLWSYFSFSHSMHFLFKKSNYLKCVYKNYFLKSYFFN